MASPSSNVSESMSQNNNPQRFLQNFVQIHVHVLVKFYQQTAWLLIHTKHPKFMQLGKGRKSYPILNKPTWEISAITPCLKLNRAGPLLIISTTLPKQI